MSRAHIPLAGQRWRALRVAVFQRDGYRCTKCSLPGRLECDHVWPLQRGGDPWSMENLQSLCRGCHVAKTAMENRREIDPAWRSLCDELRRGL